jgi:hypothetical protein
MFCTCSRQVNKDAGSKGLHAVSDGVGEAAEDVIPYRAPGPATVRCQNHINTSMITYTCCHLFDTYAAVAHRWNMLDATAVTRGVFTSCRHATASELFAWLPQHADHTCNRWATTKVYALTNGMKGASARGFLIITHTHSFCGRKHIRRSSSTHSCTHQGRVHVLRAHSCQLDAVRGQAGRKRAHKVHHACLGCCIVGASSHGEDACRSAGNVCVEKWRSAKVTAED